MKLKKRNCLVFLLIVLLIGIASYFILNNYKDDSAIYESNNNYESIKEDDKEDINEDVITIEDENEQVEKIVDVEDDSTIPIEIVKEEKKEEKASLKKQETKVEEKKEEIVKEEPKTEHINVEKIKYDKNVIKMVIGDSIELNPIISPSNATNQEVIYSTSDSSVLDVNSSGKITALKYSSNPTFVYIKSKENPDISFRVQVYVFYDIKIQSLSFPKSTDTVDLVQGPIYRLKVNAPFADLESQKYAYTGLCIEYTSSNPDVARVQASNFDSLYLNKAGTTIITAKYRDGKTAQMELHVINSSGDDKSTDEKIMEGFNKENEKEE